MLSSGSKKQAAYIHSINSGPQVFQPHFGNGIKTVKTHNEDSLIGSNVYRISTMGNSITKCGIKSINFSSNQYNEDPTTTEINFSNNASIP
jgi:uncharacterized protein YqhQ